MSPRRTSIQDRRQRRSTVRKKADMGWFRALFHRPGRGPEARRPKTPLDLNLVEATRVAREIEINNPEVIIAGVRQLRRRGSGPTWVIDVVNRSSGRMVSLDQRDHWTRRLQEILPGRSLEEARIIHCSRVAPPGRSATSLLS